MLTLVLEVLNLAPELNFIRKRFGDEVSQRLRKDFAETAQRPRFAPSAESSSEEPAMAGSAKPTKPFFFLLPS